MRCMVNRTPVAGPWGGGNLFVRALCDKLTRDGHEVVHTLSQRPDKIIVVDPRQESGCDSIESIINYARSTGSKVTIRINECDARKGTLGLDQFLSDVSAYCDSTVFVSRWMQDYHVKKGWKCSNTSVTYNGVDRGVFHAREKINNGKINLVTHHWSNNPMKGFDIYEALDKLIKNDDRFTFTYIGRDRGTFKNTRVVQPLAGMSLGDELGRYDAYVSASLFDPGPNHVIESIACRIPTFAITDGGGACEFVGNDWIYNNLEELLVKMQYAKPNIDPFLTWDECIGGFLGNVA